MIYSEKFYTTMISGEKEFTKKVAYIFIKLKLWQIAVTYKYILQQTISMKYSKILCKVSFDLEFLEILHKKNAKMGQIR